jgi:hypothetical protein
VRPRRAFLSRPLANRNYAIELLPGGHSGSGFARNHIPGGDQLKAIRYLTPEGARLLTRRSLLLEKAIHLVPDLIANAPESIEPDLFIALDLGMVFETPVNAFRLARKHRAVVTRGVTEGNHVIELVARKFVYPHERDVAYSENYRPDRERPAQTDPEPGDGATGM